MSKSHPKVNKVLNRAILEVVENQLRDNNPPETKQTYERLLNAGYSDAEARNLLGCVISSEIFGIMKTHEPYDQNRFVSMLKRLPTLPWE